MGARQPRSFSTTPSPSRPYAVLLPAASSAVSTRPGCWGSSAMFGGRSRRRMFVVVAALTGGSVAIAGGVGFVGLVMPHVARMLTGADNRRVLPLAALLGALFLLWADMLARTLVAPGELPIGVIAALVGAPVFGALLRSSLGRKEAG